MNEQEQSKTNQVSIKRILVIITIVFLFFTTILFGYLYTTKDLNVDSKEYIKTSEEQDNLEDTEKVEKETNCDFEDLMEKYISNDSKRVHFTYGAILSKNPYPNSPYTACKDTLINKIENIIEIQEDGKLDEDLKEELKFNIGQDYVEYLIDDCFIIPASEYGQIWKVDIIKETLDLFWEIEDPQYYVGIYGLSVISEDNTARVFFATSPSGLGGSEEDSYIIDNLLKDMCEKEILGTWMYDSSTDTITQIALAEECLPNN